MASGHFLIPLPVSPPPISCHSSPLYLNKRGEKPKLKKEIRGCYSILPGHQFSVVLPLLFAHIVTHENRTSPRPVCQWSPCFSVLLLLLEWAKPFSARADDILASPLCNPVLCQDFNVLKLRPEERCAFQRSQLYYLKWTLKRRYCLHVTHMAPTGAVQVKKKMSKQWLYIFFVCSWTINVHLYPEVKGHKAEELLNWNMNRYSPVSVPCC